MLVISARSWFTNKEAEAQAILKLGLDPWVLQEIRTSWEDNETRLDPADVRAYGIECLEDLRDLLADSPAYQETVDAIHHLLAKEVEA